MKSLWSTELTVNEKIKTPVTILKEQANLLGKKTQGIVNANVTSTSLFDSDFEFNFIISSSLFNFNYKLFTIEYGLKYYPVKIHINKTIVSISENRDSFIEMLRLIFNSEKTTKILKAIIAHSDL